MACRKILGSFKTFGKQCRAFKYHDTIFFYGSVAATAASGSFDVFLSNGADLGFRSMSNGHMAGSMAVS